MADNAPGTPVINYGANAPGTPVINYAEKNMQVTPTISRSAKKVGFTPSSISRKSNQIETPLTKLKLGRFHTQANINKHRKRKEHILSHRRERMDAKFAQQNAENVNLLLSNKKTIPNYWLYNSRRKSRNTHIRERPEWRKKIKDKKQFKKDEEEYETRIGVYRGSPKRYGNTMRLLRGREGRGPLTANQRRHIEGAKNPRHMIATNYNDLHNIIDFPKHYVIGSTVSRENNAQSDMNKYILIENEHGEKKFVKKTTANPYNGGTRRIRQKH